MVSNGLSDHDGGLAQLGEHLVCKQGVDGSIPSSSTIASQRGLFVSGLVRLLTVLGLLSDVQ